MKINTSPSLTLGLLTLLISAPISTSFAGEFSATIGAGADISPDYEGSNDYEIGAIPFIELGWEAESDIPENRTSLQFGFHDVSLGFPSGLNVGLVRLYRPEGLYQMHAGVTYGGGRDEDDNLALKGMGDIDGSAMGLINFNYSSENHGWDAGLTLSHDLENKTDSTTLDTSVGYTLPLGKTVSLSSHATISFANDKHMQSYFGVTQAQAATSSHSQYDVGAGLKSSGIEMELNWQISEHVGFVFNTGYSHLMGDAVDSPFVKNEGDDNQFAASVGLAYSF